LSYSPIPASKIPLTVKRLNLGCIPIILADSCGTSKVTLLPTLTPNFVAKPMPIKILDLPNSALPDLIIRLKVDDLFNAKKITNEVVNSLNSSQYYGVDWTQQKAIQCQQNP
jgi:hypothetical protein